MITNPLFRQILKKRFKGHLPLYVFCVFASSTISSAFSQEYPPSQSVYYRVLKFQKQLDAFHRVILGPY